MDTMMTTYRLGAKAGEFIEVFYDSVREALVIRGGDAIIVAPSASNVLYVRMRP